MPHKLLPDDDIRLGYHDRHEAVPCALRSLLLPGVEILGRVLTGHSTGRKAEERVALVTRDLQIVLGVDEREAQPIPGLGYDASEPLRRLPLVDHKAVEKAEERRDGTDRAQDGDESGAHIAGQQRLHVGKAGHQNNAGEFDPLHGIVLRNAAGNCGAETLAHDYDPATRNTGHFHGPLDSGNPIQNEAPFRGRPGRLTEPTVVNCQYMIVGSICQCMVGVSAYSLGEMAGILQKRSQPGVSRLGCWCTDPVNCPSQC